MEAISIYYELLLVVIWNSEGILEQWPWSSDFLCSRIGASLAGVVSSHIQDTSFEGVLSFC